MIFLAGIGVAMAFSFNTMYELSQKSAEVTTIDNIAIFVEATPLKEFKVIGKVKVPIVSFGQADSFFDQRDYIIEQCKKNYPTANGLIFNCSKTKYWADVIAFKK